MNESGVVAESDDGEVLAEDEEKYDAAITRFSIRPSCSPSSKI
jgi:hypothetical protein